MDCMNSAPIAQGNSFVASFEQNKVVGILVDDEFVAFAEDIIFQPSALDYGHNLAIEDFYREIAIPFA